MPCPDAHYTLELINHETGDRLKIELIDLPFPGSRSYDSHLPLLTSGFVHVAPLPAGSIRVRVNAEWARKVPLASKTMVTKQLRGWLVKH